MHGTESSSSKARELPQPWGTVQVSYFEATCPIMFLLRNERYVSEIRTHLNMYIRRAGAWPCMATGSRNEGTPLDACF